MLGFIVIVFEDQRPKRRAPWPMHVSQLELALEMVWPDVVRQPLLVGGPQVVPYRGLP